MANELNTVYKISKDIAAREIEDEIVIVPIISGVGSMDDDLYTLNETGRQIWKLINGKNSIADIIGKLEKEYDATVDQITEEVGELVLMLLEKGIIVEA